MIRPEALKEGSRVMIISPSGAIDNDIISGAATRLEKFGFKVEVSPNADKRLGVFAGSDQERVSDMQSALDRPDIEAVICARGGYGAIRVVDNLDWSKFMEHPKWIVGFSDITVFHQKLSLLGVESIHGTMAKGLLENIGNNVPLLIDMLEGERHTYLWNNSIGVDGNASGALVGGNLSIIYSLRGTNLDLNLKDKILFIEDIGEYNYHLDRMLQNLEHGGIFNQISGLVVGEFIDMKDGATPYGYGYREIIMETVSKYNFPVAFDIPVGHGEDQLPLALGAKVHLRVESGESELEYI